MFCYTSIGMSRLMVAFCHRRASCACARQGIVMCVIMCVNSGLAWVMAIVHLRFFNKTPLRHMAPKWLKAGFRPTFQRSLAKMNGPQGARIWTLLTFLCGQFWRIRFAELVMIRWIFWSWSCYENWPWSLKKYCVPPVMLSRVEWSLSLKMKLAIFDKCFCLLLYCHWL